MAQCGEKPSIRIAKIRQNLEHVNVQEVNSVNGESVSASSESLGVVNAQDFRDNAVIGSLAETVATAAVLPQKDMVNVLGNTETMQQQGGGTNIGGEGGFIGGNVNGSNTDGAGNLIYENPNVLENAPSFKVPANPLLPPEYKEVLNYNDIQFLNGFIRTQIGRYIRVECLVGSNNIEIRAGYLIGVGLNYILLQESITGNVLSIDFWSIKFVYYYYNEEEAERALAFGPLLNSPVR